MITERKRLHPASQAWKPQWAAVILDSEPVAVLAVHKDRNVVFANAAAQTLFGRPPGQLVGSDFLDLWPEPSRGQLSRRHISLVRGHSRQEVSHASLEHEGTTLPVLVTGVGIRSTDDATNLTSYTIQRTHLPRTPTKQAPSRDALLDQLPPLLEWIQGQGAPKIRRGPYIAVLICNLGAATLQDTEHTQTASERLLLHVNGPDDHILQLNRETLAVLMNGIDGSSTAVAHARRIQMIISSKERRASNAQTPAIGLAIDNRGAPLLPILTSAISAYINAHTDSQHLIVRLPPQQGQPPVPNVYPPRTPGLAPQPQHPQRRQAKTDARTGAPPPTDDATKPNHTNTGSHDWWKPVG